MEPSSPNPQPSLITLIEVEVANEFQVDSKCEMPTRDRWQIVWFAAIAIAAVSGVMFGLSYLVQKLGL